VPKPLRVAALVSGGGTNLQSLLDRFRTGGSDVARVVLVVGSRAGIGALARAERHGVRSLVVDPRTAPAEHCAEEMRAALEGEAVDLVVLAGYMHLVPASLVQRYAGRMINIHPALLPGFGGHGMYGRRVHEAVLAAGVRVSGATVHLVDEAYDRGRILAQWPVPVHAADTPGTLAARVLEVEHLLLPGVVEAFAGADAASSPAEDGWAFAPSVAGPHRDAAIRTAAAQQAALALALVGRTG
jgi:phosphoribosylglycinamide formyltransferase 1